MHWIDPACLPESKGSVTQFLLNPHGEIDGFILGKNKQVHFPPHMAKQLAKHVHIGDKISVRGIKPRDADLIAAVQITSASGVALVDEGPSHPPVHADSKVARKAMDVAGEVVMSLFGPKGELRGALLKDGSSLRMPPHAATALSTYLAPGAHVHAWGQGIKNKFGSVIEVEEIAELVDA